MWPASASARAVSAPKPLEAPVMTIICFMTHILLIDVLRGLMRRFGLHHATLGAQHPALDPSPVGTDEEGPRGRDIPGRARPLPPVPPCPTNHPIPRHSPPRQTGRGPS